MNRNVPVQVGASKDWGAIEVGGQFSAALKNDGSLWVWGSNGWGQLGDGTTVIRNIPAQVGDRNYWRAVSVGETHSVAIRTDGSLWAWGWNNNYQLGDGTNIDRHYPVRVGMPGGWAAPQIQEALPIPQPAPLHEEPAAEQPTSPPYTTLLMLLILAIAVFLPLYRRTRRDTPPATTGNQEHDKTLEAIEGYISILRGLDKAGQGKLEEPVREILQTTQQIAVQLRKHPAGISKVHQFSDYTLPTTIKLLQNYDELRRQPIKGKSIMAVMENIEGMGDTIVSAFHRQLDALFQDKVLDIEMELGVMKDMLRQADDITDIASGENK